MICVRLSDQADENAGWIATTKRTQCGCDVCYHVRQELHMHRVVLALLLAATLVPAADARGPQFKPFTFTFNATFHTHSES